MSQAPRRASRAANMVAAALKSAGRVREADVTDQLTPSQANTSAQTSPLASAPSGVPVPEPEADLRSIAESSREREWLKPSFAKELYLGRFRLDLIHPHPTSSPEDVEHGERFLTGLRAFCEREVDGAAIERE